MNFYNHTYPSKEVIDRLQVCRVVHLGDTSDVADRIHHATRVADKGQHINVWIRYVNLYVRESDKITPAQVNLNHQFLQQAYDATNNDDIEKVKNLETQNTLRYPYHRIRNTGANIRFFPETIEHIEYLKTDRYIKLDDSVNVLNEVNDAAGNIKEVINVVIGSFGLSFLELNQAVLGVAGIGSNIAFVETGTIGNRQQPGANGQLKGMGVTLIHEIGHCMNLLHPFSDDNPGSCVQPYSDLPPQKNHNLQAVEGIDDEFGLVLNDNRYIDATNNTEEFSCPKTGDDRFECPMNFMDYAPDRFGTIFSQQQIIAARDYALNGFDETSTLLSIRLRPKRFADNPTVVLRQGNTLHPLLEGASLLPFGASEDVFGNDEFRPTGVLTGFTAEEVNDLRDDDALSTTTLIYIIASLVSAVLILGIVIYVVRQRSTGVIIGGSNTSPSEIDTTAS